MYANEYKRQRREKESVSEGERERERESERERERERERKKERQVWLGEGKTQQNTQILVMITALDLVCSQWTQRRKRARKWRKKEDGNGSEYRKRGLSAPSPCSRRASGK